VGTGTGTGTGTDGNGRNNGPVGHKLAVRRGHGRSTNTSTPQRAAFHNLYKPLNRAATTMPTTTTHGLKYQFIHSQQQKNHHSVRPVGPSRLIIPLPFSPCSAGVTPSPSHPISQTSIPYAHRLDRHPNSARSLARLDYALHRRIRSARNLSLLCVQLQKFGESVSPLPLAT
jgi:hypothetical protein